MSVSNKKMISTIVYFTLAVLSLLSAAFFIYTISVREVVAWARVIYYVWAALVILTIILDIMFSRSGENKVVTGIAVYVISLLALAMTCILYFVNSGFTMLLTEMFILFTSVSFVSLLVTGFMIATWVVGEAMVEHATADKQIEERK